jgi:predicted phage terminase large subunit-like protein
MLANKFSEEARKLLEQHGQRYFGVHVDPRCCGKKEWGLANRNGHFYATGIAGGLTGLRLNLLIIDDPVKNSADAASPVIQQRNWDWWESTSTSRMEPDGIHIMVLTRWHQKDIGGQVLEREASGWEVISLPALAEEDDPLGRVVGEPLWPERFSLEWLEQRRLDRTPYWWAAMYQQRPGLWGEASWPAEYFEDIWTEDWPDDFNLSAVAIDPATGRDKQKGDYSAIVFVGWKDGQQYADAWLGREPAPELVKRILSWQVHRSPTVMSCEANGFQELLGTLLMTEARKQGLLGFSCQEVNNTTNKQDRIEAAVTKYLTRGKLKLRKGSPGAKLLFEQMREIPNGAHDDGPDALAMAITMCERWVEHTKQTQGPLEQLVRVA